MLENIMDPNDIADGFKSLLDQSHAYLDGLEDGSGKARAQRLLKLVHGALDALKDHCVGEGIVQPFSGGDPKPPGP